MKSSLIIGFLTLILPHYSWAQLGGRTRSSPSLPSNPQSPTDFQSTSKGRRPAATPQQGNTPTGTGATNAGDGFQGGDMVIIDGNSALWEGKKRRRQKHIPKTHNVKEGDTLWSICQRYYEDPWAWPQLWAINEKITNPHWIYPDDIIYLLRGQDVVASTNRQRPEQIIITRESIKKNTPVYLKQNAFVDPTELGEAGEIVGSPEERLLISQGDEVYLKGAKTFKIKGGESYSVYRLRNKLFNAKGEHVGNLVAILGTARVKHNPKGKMATAVITESTNAIERGDRIGPLRRRYHELPIQPANKNVEGRVLGAVRDTTYHGIHDLVFVDKGLKHGVSKGNRFLVSRRGDGYKRLITQKDDEDPSFPDAIVAEILIIDTREKMSVGLVTRSSKEIAKNDRVQMRRGY